MSRRYLPMTQSEIERYIAAQRVARVASLVANDGPIHIVPMWYVVIDGRIVFRSASDAGTKLRNIRQTSKVSLVIDDGGEYDTLRGVMMQGRARIMEPDEIAPARRAFREKYYSGGAEFSSIPLPVQKILSGLTFTYAEFIPERVVSWDNTKWKQAE